VVTYDEATAAFYDHGRAAGGTNIPNPDDIDSPAAGATPASFAPTFAFDPALGFPRARPSSPRRGSKKGARRFRRATQHTSVLADAEKALRACSAFPDEAPTRRAAAFRRPCSTSWTPPAHRLARHGCRVPALPPGPGLARRPATTPSNLPLDDNQQEILNGPCPSWA